MKKVVFALIVLLGLMIGCSNPAEPKIYTSPVELRGCVWQSPVVPPDGHAFYRFDERKIQHYFGTSFPGNFDETSHNAYNITFAEGNTISYEIERGRIVTLTWGLSEDHQILTLSSSDLVASLSGDMEQIAGSGVSDDNKAGGNSPGLFPARDRDWGRVFA